MRFLALLFLIPVLLHAQEQWHFVNPQPHGNNIIDMGLRGGLTWQVGDRGSVYTSGDLDTWTRHESGTRNSLRGITFFGENAVICGEAGTILSGSSPGALIVRNLNTPDWLEGIASSDRAIVAVGDNGAIYYSNDAQNWSRKGNFTASLRSVAYGGGQFLCVGENGFVATSDDGQSWQQHSGLPEINLNRTSYLDDRFWIVGDGGTAFTNTFRMTFSAVATAVTNNLTAIAGNGTEILLAGDQVALLGSSAGTDWILQTDAADPTLAPLWPYYSALWTGITFVLGGRTGLQANGTRAAASSGWEWSSRVQPTRNWLWAATRAENLFAAVGANGTVVTSADGSEWTREVTPTEVRSQILLGIGGNTNALVTVGSAGTILVSPNIYSESISTNLDGSFVTNKVSLLGIYWNLGISPATDDLQGVAANATTYIVTGARGTIFSSNNGTNWTASVSGVTTYLSGATAGPIGFLACGDAGTILSSSDGLNWIRRNTPVSSWIYRILYAGNKYVAVGQGGLILTSNDGIEWTQRTSGITDWINDVTFASGRWFAVASGGWILSSSDCVNWTPMKSPSAKSLYGAATDGIQVIAAGTEGVILRSQVAAPSTPVNFLSYQVIGGSSFMLFGGTPGQRFTVESSSNFESWSLESTLEITDPSGTVILERPNNTSVTFFRTKLLTQ